MATTSQQSDKNSRYFSGAMDNTRGGIQGLLFGRARLDFREDICTRRPAEGTFSQFFHDSMSISFKTEHLHFAGPPPESGGGFLRQNLERDLIW